MTKHLNIIKQSVSPIAIFAIMHSFVLPLEASKQGQDMPGLQEEGKRTSSVKHSNKSSHSKKKSSHGQRKSTSSVNHHKEEEQKLSDIRDLRLYFNKGNLEITFDNHHDLLKFSKVHENAFNAYDKGVVIKGWKASTNSDSLASLLLAFNHIKSFKCDIVWDVDGEATQLIGKSIQFYENLEELHIGGCHLTDTNMNEVLEAIPQPQKLKVLDVRNNALNEGTLKKLQAHFTNLTTLQSDIVLSPVIRNSLINPPSVVANPLAHNVSIPVELEKQPNVTTRILTQVEFDYEQGKKYFDVRDYPQAKLFFEKVAMQGHAGAQAKLASLYCGILSMDYGKARELYEKAAAQGNIDGYTGLGALYANGCSVPKDEIKARAWFDKAKRECEEGAAQGNAEAQFSLGRLYHFGQGMSVDLGKANEWYAKAAIQGHAEAQYFLATNYRYGQGIPKDEAKGTEWLQKAAAQGNASAQNLLAQISQVSQVFLPTIKPLPAIKPLPPIKPSPLVYNSNTSVQTQAQSDFEKGKAYFDKNDYPSAKIFFEKAAAEGHAGAQTGLGTLYSRYGDHGKTREWYEKAAAQGFAEAQVALGGCYHYGLAGIPKDENKAKEWYEKAVAQGHGEANSRLQSMGFSPIQPSISTTNSSVTIKQEERSVVNTNTSEQSDFEKGMEYFHKKDYTSARLFLEKASAQGNVEALTYLGVTYAVSGNNERAVGYYEKGAVQGSATAQTSLGSAFKYGLGVPKDENKANEWFRKAKEGHEKAAAQGDLAAQSALATLYNSGWGVPKDEKKAQEWYGKARAGYETAAIQGSVEAQRLLASYYYLGWGGPKDENKAIEWAGKAAMQGDHAAQELLGLWRKQGTGQFQNEGQSNYEQGEKCYLNKDYVQAKLFYEKAADCGHSNAQCRLGSLYHNGQGVPVDPNKGKDWYSKAAGKAHPAAQYLSFGESFGVGMSKEARVWFETASAQGDTYAQKVLSKASDKAQADYEQGQKLYSYKHYASAKMSYEKAAEQGHAAAQYSLGVLYREGKKGVPKDAFKSREWLDKASAQGYVPTQQGGPNNQRKNGGGPTLGDAADAVDLTNNVVDLIGNFF